MNIMPISTNNSTTFGQTQVKKSVPKKILTYVAAGLTGLGITACGPNYEGLKNCDVFEHIDKKELFEAFSTEYLSNVQKISDTEYTADIDIELRATLMQVEKVIYKEVSISKKIKMTQIIL